MSPVLEAVAAIAFLGLVTGLIVLQKRGPQLMLALHTPTLRLASAKLESGVKTSMTTSASSGVHGVWLDVNVASFANDSRWNADVVIEWRAGASSGTEKFPIGYDGDGHQTGPHAHGILFSPSEGSGDRGTLSLFVLPNVPPSAAIDVDVTVTMKTEADATFVAFVGLIPEAPTRARRTRIAVDQRSDIAHVCPTSFFPKLACFSASTSSNPAFS